VNQASRLLLDTPVQPTSLPEREHEVVRHSNDGGEALLGLAQRVPLKEIREITHTRDNQDSYLMPSPGPVPQPMPGHMVTPSVTHPSPFGWAQYIPSPSLPTLTPYSFLQHLAIQPKTQFTPVQSPPRVQQA
jgi:hypothetical protein